MTRGNYAEELKMLIVSCSSFTFSFQLNHDNHAITVSDVNRAVCQ